MARDPDQEPAPDGSGADSAAAAKDELAALGRWIDALPPRQREVLDLRTHHELSHGEIASLLGITPESSRANYYQALRHLRARAANETETDKGTA